MTIGLFSFKPQDKEAGLSIPFEKFKLANGLTVVLNVDKSDPIAALAIYYHVGSSR
jgi:zinc protease